MSDVAKVMQMVKDHDVKFVDFRFTDTKGKEQHVSVQFRHSQSLDRMIVEHHAQNEEKAANPKLSFFCEYFFVKRNILCLWRN